MGTMVSHRLQAPAPSTRKWKTALGHGRYQLVAPPKLTINADPQNARGAPMLSSSGTVRRQASPAADRGRSAHRRHRKPRTSLRPASPALAPCVLTRAPVSRQRGPRSNGSPPQTCRRRCASRNSQCCRAPGVPPAPPSDGGHDPDAPPAQRELRQGRDHRTPQPLRYPQLFATSRDGPNDRGCPPAQ